MQRRVMTVYVTLLVLAGLGLALPLCGALATQGTAAAVLDRSSDAVRFAALAEPSVVSGSAGVMTNELSVYDQVYETPGMVLDRDGQVLAASRAGLELADLAGPGHGGAQQLPEPVRSALAGNRIDAVETIWPWQDDPLVIAEPVVSSGEVVGVVVIASPTDALRRATLIEWAWVWAGVAVLLAVGIAAAGPLARWVLRPIAELDDATTAISRGSLETRVPSGAGPPELRRLGQSFNRMADTIATLLHRQRLFVAYAGHQVRNPLAALRLRVEGLRGQLPESAHEDHTLAVEEVDRLTRTCDSLMTLAQAEQEDAPMVPARLDAVARRRVRAWSPIAQRARITLTYIGADAVETECVDGSIDQTLDVLIDNALKFAGEGATVTVDLRRDESAGTVELRVRDDGPGLPDELAHQAVRPFWRELSDESRTAAGGSGLGLSVVLMLMELQGGGLELRRAEPRGTEAVVRLPHR